MEKILVQEEKSEDLSPIFSPLIVSFDALVSFPDPRYSTYTQGRREGL